MARYNTINRAIIEGLPVPETGNKFYRFTGAKYQGQTVPAQFGVVVNYTGKRFFAIAYKIEGRERRKQIGAYPTWTIAAAIADARDIRKRVDRGDDPLEEKQQARRAATVADLCDRALTDHYSRRSKSMCRDATSMAERIIKPKIGCRKVADVTHAELDRLHQDMKATPYQANRMAAVLSKMFNLAIRWGWRTDNPAKGIERFEEHKRTRYLSPDEIGRLTVALKEYPERRAQKVAKPNGAALMERERRWGKKAADLIRLCLLTGCRRREALAARWDQFDFGKGEWVKPGSTTKTRTEHRAPLSDAAVMLLQDISTEAEKDDNGNPISPFVFPGASPDVHISEVKDEWYAIRNAADLPGVRLHDLRHTFASVLASAGASLQLVGALLGHSNPLTTARYSHLYNDPLRQAANTVGAVVTGVKSAELIKLRGRLK